MRDQLVQAFLFAQETTTEGEEPEGSLIDVVPGLMVWTIITFLIVLWVLKRFAFKPIQRLIDQRRDRIREALDEADKARTEARELRELTAKEREQAKADREHILEEARRQSKRLVEQAQGACRRRPQGAAGEEPRGARRREREAARADPPRRRRAHALRR